MLLSGNVAILSQDKKSIIEIKDLGTEPVVCRPGFVLPFIEIKPECKSDEYYAGFVDSLTKKQATRVWQVKKMPEFADLTKVQFSALLYHLGIEKKIYEIIETGYTDKFEKAIIVGRLQSADSYNRDGYVNDLFKKMNLDIGKVNKAWKEISKLA